MSFELPTELIDKIMEEVKEPIHKKLLKLDLFDLTCLKLELNRIYDMKCSHKREELIKYKNCVVNINDLLYRIEYINKRDIRCNPVIMIDHMKELYEEQNGKKDNTHDDMDLSNYCYTIREDKKNNIKYRIIYQYMIWIKYEDIKKIELVYDIPLDVFNWNRGIKD